MASHQLGQSHLQALQRPSFEAIFTHLPASVADTVTITALYLERWSTDGMFQVTIGIFACEIGQVMN